MYYRISPLTNRLTSASQMLAYHPQGLRPLLHTDPAPLHMPYEPVKAPDVTFIAKEAGPARTFAAAAVGHGSGNYGSVPPKLKALQEKFQKDDGLPVHLKGGQQDYVYYYSTVAMCVVGTAWAFYEIFKMAMPKKR